MYALPWRLWYTLTICTSYADGIIGRIDQLYLALLQDAYPGGSDRCSTCLASQNPKVRTDLLL